jgi:hypothetical protein
VTGFQGVQQQRETDAQIAMSSLQDELRLTQQAFHAKHNQLEGIFVARSMPAFLHTWLQSCQGVPLSLWGQELHIAYVVCSVFCMHFLL